MPPFRVLFVCIGNVCRSPLGERLLASMLPPDRFEVASAGIYAMAGSPMSPEAAVHLAPYGATAEGFTARQLLPAMVADADLVLTATRDIRSRVLEESPGGLRRTFTVREFAALVDVVEPQDDPRRLVAEAASQRSRAGAGDHDIPDPFGRGEEANALAAELMATAVERIAKALG